jgi:hypothetical protein
MTDIEHLQITVYESDNGARLQIKRSYGSNVEVQILCALIADAVSKLMNNVESTQEQP